MNNHEAKNTEQSISKYADIIGLPHYRSSIRQPMSMEARAAQFAPFAALTGHDEAIAETARLTSDPPELSDEEQKALSRKLQPLIERISDHPEVTIVHFQHDAVKKGGAYISTTGRLKKFDELARTLTLLDGTDISLQSIVSIL